MELRTTGGASLDRENLGAVVPPGGITVDPVASTVPCGTGVTAAFTTTRTGRSTVTATITVPAVCRTPPVGPSHSQRVAKCR
ncbi:hypothetical protein PUR61_38740 [Streptomyces sp. BE20]|uniref:hypothetical protein n=1 Tax=Streptomyces sp. BE20 TaxID=3002525 RepID=UPI002E79409A|nr:hypothetical protein [Streptomyces sp. BE20]MEE1828072.1 hypothetical protein [Streptomyces sp. BE20]